ncbi:uncharacterized protein K460DRAFT_362069 [Cucurbitaria berberidis CBS 394.84]|uniref:Uncharacterized protein n=1 Tax=Cucurbitaria berberidis CBS 394.84 TaxID=1168544 RepID=A0A9P4GU12_9PLEO|nr:uncharacterized protein K460DRAFT_362069 [Cucurbitaria berberidis CBS 394.84]KAF1851322.1 hypothetical protein K460DRAFT_362069 [Cucurbitaria berberidis CBS 394.84]
MPPKKLEQRSSSKPPAKSDDLPEAELKDIANQKASPESKLQDAAEKAEAALAAQKTASSLRAAADVIKDPKKREKYLQDAYKKETEAHGNSKKARMLSSGAFQGSVGGGGIGMAVGAGLGTVVGTVVGTVATIPTTAVGGLVGAGVGGFHGPWINLKNAGKGGDGKKEDKESEDKKGGEQSDGVEEGEAEAEEIDEEDAVPNPEVLRQAADMVARERETAGQSDSPHEKVGDVDDEGAKKGKKKPRKLEVRSKQAPSAGGQQKPIAA